MGKPEFNQDGLQSFLQSRKIATLEELKKALGSSSTMTVFRKLKPLGYQTSYSHRGKYYALAGTPLFDQQGLWDYDGVWFSRHGNLLSTSQRFVDAAEAGLTATELQHRLHVEVKEPLLQLYRQKRIEREKIQDLYVYLARDPGQQRSQRLRREDRQATWELGEPVTEAGVSPELKAAIVLFFSLLDEQQRRLYAGLEAHKLGHGGDRRMADFLGIGVHTVARGRQDLFTNQVQRQGVRQKGGGRKPVEKKRPK
jgi:hypothetical protein